MITLLSLQLLPARLLRLVAIVAETLDEAAALRRRLSKKHRLGFDS
jgi:hypothetical protein